MAETTPPPPTGGPDAPMDDRIEDLHIEQELQDSYLTYAMSTIMDRALPDVRDGLKPSQRRILVAMNDLNLRPGSKHLKCAKIAGNTSGDYHPHGEAIVYPTLVRLGQDWVMRYPLIHPQGNFGSNDGDPPAAMRYTEARPTARRGELLADLNSTRSTSSPTTTTGSWSRPCCPGKFPNLLVNGSTGIAVGMACNLLPHNLREICDAIVKVIDDKDVTLQELLEIVPGPDFPTGGIICGATASTRATRPAAGRSALRAKIRLRSRRAARPSR
jgi:DNA gyrase subunit A